MRHERCDGCGNHIRWLMWNRQTSRLELEIEAVPIELGKVTVVSTLARFGYWPETDGPEDVRSEYVEVETVAVAPWPVLKQMEDATRKIKWRELWREAKEVA